MHLRGGIKKYRKHKGSAPEAGFTLVEMLVSVSIFAIVMVVSVGTLIVLVSASGAAQESQTVTSNLSFALDSMSRSIRTGRGYYCTNSPNPATQTGVNDCPLGGRGLVYTDSEIGKRVAYWFDPAKFAIMRKVESGAWLPLTSDRVKIEDALFYVTGAASSDTVQPAVRMIIRGVMADSVGEPSKFYIQTTVVQRIIDK